MELVIESNDLMAASYVMLDGRACFYQDMGPPHGYMYGPSIFSMLSSADASEAHANSVESTSSTNSSSSSIVTNFDTNDIVPFANEPQQLTAAVESALLSSDQHAKVDGYGGEGANAWADGNASNARERAAVMAAWEPVAHAFQSQRFAARGAVYEWGQGDGMLSQQLQEWAQQV